ncbi:hypothetical protein ACWD8L_00365 [Streptomyces sp. NPDC005133]
MSDDKAPSFNQPNWQVAGDVYNTQGNVILSRDGTRSDFVEALRSMRVDLNRIEAVDTEDRAEIESGIEAVISETEKPDAERGRVVRMLKSVTDRLQALQGAGDSVLAFGKTVADLAHWASGNF